MEAERKRQQPSTREQDDIPRVLQGNWDWILDWREKPSESTLGDANFVKRREGETPSCVDSLARVESKSERHRQGERERERLREGRERHDRQETDFAITVLSIFVSPIRQHPRCRLSRVRSKHLRLPAFVLLHSLSHFYVDCTKSSEEKKSELNFRSLLAGRNNEVRNRKKERKKKRDSPARIEPRGVLTFHRLKRSFVPLASATSHFSLVQRCAFIGFQRASSSNHLSFLRETLKVLHNEILFHAAYEHDGGQTRDPACEQRCVDEL